MFAALAMGSEEAERIFLYGKTLREKMDANIELFKQMIAMVVEHYQPPREEQCQPSQNQNNLATSPPTDIS